MRCEVFYSWFNKSYTYNIAVLFYIVILTLNYRAPEGINELSKLILELNSQKYKKYAYCNLSSGSSQERQEGNSQYI